MIKTYTIKINAPLEKSFSVVDKDEKIRKWVIRPEYKNRDNEKMEGLKFHQHVPGFIDFDGEIIAFKRPFQLGLGLKSGKLKGSFFYDFEAIDPKATKLTCTLDIFEGTISKTFMTLTLPVINRIINNHIKHLKKLAET